MSLDSIIRSNRHLVEVGVATEDELAAVVGEVHVIGDVRGEIEDWHVIAIRDRVERTTSLHVLGRMLHSRGRLTSDVVMLAAERSVVRTQNSVYLLGEPAQDLPTIEMLLTVAGALRSWGYDAAYGLDVPTEFEFAMRRRDV